MFTKENLLIAALVLLAVALLAAMLFFRLYWYVAFLERSKTKALRKASEIVHQDMFGLDDLMKLRTIIDDAIKL